MGFIVLWFQLLVAQSCVSVLFQHDMSLMEYVMEESCLPHDGSKHEVGDSNVPIRGCPVS